MMYIHLAVLLICYFQGIFAGFAIQGPYPSSYVAFSSTFKEPPIPQVVTDFKSHLIQHKWYVCISTGLMAVHT